MKMRAVKTLGLIVALAASLAPARALAATPGDNGQPTGLADPLILALIVNDDVFVGSISQDEIDSLEKAKGPKTYKITGNS